MEKKDSEILFDYLKSILYDRVIGELPTEELSPEARELGEGLQFLGDCVLELRRYAGDISRGNLDTEFPDKGNPLCLELKNLHSNLNHLTWKAKQVAAGDYSQRVSYLGEFSDAFNLMIRQLEDRERRLKEELGEKEHRAVVLQSYNDMFASLTRRYSEWIIVADRGSKKVRYCNKQKEGELGTGPDCKSCPYKLSIREYIFSHEEEKAWETRDRNSGRWYFVNTFYIEWEKMPACAYMIEDITAERLEGERLSRLAYRDKLTELFNRRYLEEQAEACLKKGRRFTLCYIDIDKLKYVNDHFGHGEGDRYIRYVVGEIKKELDKSDILARIGGDEFAVLSEDKGADLMRALIGAARARVGRELQAQTLEGQYQGGFSFGVVEYGGEAGTTFEDIVKRADEEMYRYKETHR